MRFLLFLIALLAFIPKTHSQDAFKFDDLPFLGAAVPVAGGGAFSPSDIPGLQFWFKGDTLIGAYEGATTNLWLDSSANGWYVTNVTSGQYPYITNTFNGVSGKAALYFDGTDDSLYVTNATAKDIARRGSNATIVAVCRQSANTAAKSLFSLSRNTTAASREALYFNNLERLAVLGKTLDADTSLSFACASTSVQDKGLVVQANINHTNTVTVTGAVIDIYTNNVLAGTGSGTMSATFTSDTASQAITLGSQFGTLSFLGEIAEILYYTPAISDSDRTNLYNHLVDKYTIVR